MFKRFPKHNGFVSYNVSCNIDLGTGTIYENSLKKKIATSGAKQNPKKNCVETCRCPHKMFLNNIRYKLEIL